ncbi:hypothetical protein lerEdw1_008420 [Lerista edwardsae]|nr:hypothetical protein lerEdw1_008420 [Lerista edwardsae]
MLRSFCSTISAYHLACSNCVENCTYVLFSNKITFLMDLLMHQLMGWNCRELRALFSPQPAIHKFLDCYDDDDDDDDASVLETPFQSQKFQHLPLAGQLPVKRTYIHDPAEDTSKVYVPDDYNATLGRTANKQVFEGLTTGVLRIVAVVFRGLISSGLYGNSQTSAPKLIQEMKSKTSQVEVLNSRIQDLISYVVNIGLIEKLCCCFLSVQGPIDENPKIATFLQNATAVLTGMCQLCFAINGRTCGIFDSARQDPTGLTATLEATDLVGVLHMLYCILFHGTIADPSTASPKETYAETTVQSIVGAEGLSLAFRHIISSLLWHCSQHTCEALLHEVIVCVGYFTVNHPDNQVIVQSGRHPTVLQKLCQLPFQYFSDPRLIKVLFPTLIASCYNNSQNKIILEQEMSCVLLATFIQYSLCVHSSEKIFSSQDYLELANRFPRQTWEEARQFFLKKEKK